MGKLYRREGSPYWSAEWYDRGGHRVRKSTGCSDRTAARQWLAERERDATRPLDETEDDSPLDRALAELRDTADWAPRTARANASRLGHLSRLMGRGELARIRSED